MLLVSAPSQPDKGHVTTLAAPAPPLRALHRWAGAGRSRLADPVAAGAAAAAAALTGADPRLVVVLASVTYDLPDLLRGVRSVTHDVPLVGCSTAGEIAADGPGDGGVVVFALGGPGFDVATACATRASTRLRAAGAEVAAALRPVAGRPHQVLLLLTDGLAGDQQEIVRGAYGVVGATVPLVGGCAGDDLRMKATYQLHGGDVHTDSVVGVAISSDAPFGIGVRHGWRTVSDPMLVTRSGGNRVFTLDDKPALDVYLDRLGAPADARVDAAAFTRFALTHPLGMARRSGEPQVRFVAEAGFADRSLGCIAEVPQGGLTWFMEGDAASVLGATDVATDAAVAALGGQPPLGLLAFDCIARREVLGPYGIEAETARVASHGAPVAGFYTYGEIARTHGITGFHNQTLVVLAVA